MKLKQVKMEDESVQADSMPFPAAKGRRKIPQIKEEAVSPKDDDHQTSPASTFNCTTKPHSCHESAEEVGPPGSIRKRPLKKEEVQEDESKFVRESAEEVGPQGSTRKRPLKKEEVQDDESKYQELKKIRGAPKGPRIRDRFSDWKGPSPEECVMVHDQLVSVHGLPRPINLALQQDHVEQILNSSQDSPGDHDSSRLVLDSLCRTILSQNTTDITSARAFMRLKDSFPTWQDVLAAPDSAVEESIRQGGLAEVKTARIKNILRWILENRPDHCTAGPNGCLEPSLEYLRSWSNDSIKEELSAFKGVGPKTISCVLMFTLDRADFPVDTHVWHIARERVKWAPKKASREDVYRILDKWVPNYLKYNLHVLMVQHGKVCSKCAKTTKKGAIKCPLSS